MIWHVRELIKYCQEYGVVNINGRYVHARPSGDMIGLCTTRRLKAAWLVLQGKADVVIWDEGQ